MTANAVTTTSAAKAMLDRQTTLSLPVRIPGRQEGHSAAVVIFDEARADRPRPYVTTEALSVEAKQAGVHQRDWEARDRLRTSLRGLRRVPRSAATTQQTAAEQREWTSRDRARAALHGRRSGDPGADGAAMLARPQRDIPIAFVSEDALAASLTRQFSDAHLIDRLWDAGQLNDWQYATANRLLQLCDATGLLASKVAMLGRIGTGYGELSDGMAQARRSLNKRLREISYPGSELLLGLCLGELTLRGQAARATALKGGLAHLARHWGIEQV